MLAQTVRLTFYEKINEPSDEAEILIFYLTRELSLERSASMAPRQKHAILSLFDTSYKLTFSGTKVVDN